MLSRRLTVWTRARLAKLGTQACAEPRKRIPDPGECKCKDPLARRDLDSPEKATAIQGE